MSWPWRAFSQVMRRWCTGSINYFLSQVSARATSRGPSSSTSHRNTFLLTFVFFLSLTLEVSGGEWAEDVGADPIYVQVTMHDQHPSPFPASYVHCHTPHQPHKLLKGAIYDASTPVSPTPYCPNWLQRQRTTSDEGNVFFIVVYNTETTSATPLDAALWGSASGLSGESCPGLRARLWRKCVSWLVKHAYFLAVAECYKNCSPLNNLMPYIQ